MRRRHPTGFTLTELLVSLAIFSALLVGILKVFASQHRAHAREDESVSLEENLRVATGQLGDVLREARYGAPGSLTTWIDWVSGFDANPKIIQGSGTNPDTLSFAGCLEQSIATLTNDTAAWMTGPTDISVTVSTDLPAGTTLDDELDTNTRKLIRIGDSLFAWVTAVGSTTIAIDTDLGASGNQGLPATRAIYPGGMPICRVDVYTFSIGTDATTGVKRLLRNDNHGGTAESMAEGITDLQITLPASKRVRIALAAQSERRVPTTGFLTRSMTTDVTLRN